MLVLRTPNTSLSNSHANTLVLRLNHLATLTPKIKPIEVPVLAAQTTHRAEDSGRDSGPELQPG